MSEKDLAKLLLLREADLFNSSKEELEEFEKKSGSTVSKRAEKVSILLNNVATNYKKSRLTESRRQLEESKKRKIAARDFSAFGNKKDFLLAILSKFPQIGPALTFQNRNLESLSDSDVDLALAQLDELGVVTEYLSKNENNDS